MDRSRKLSARRHPSRALLRNLWLYALLPQPGPSRPRCSVLIPARNEEPNIAPALHSVLQSSDRTELEVIVPDDGSTDRAAEIVRDISQTDPRVCLETAQPLPAGWCGKPFSCHRLAARAHHPLLIFMDADVRVSRPDSLAPRRVRRARRRGAR